MLAGVSSVDSALLVVAADDGIMPQTREHLAILSLLGIKQLIVAISKIDKVDESEQWKLSSSSVNCWPHPDFLTLIFPAQQCQRRRCP